MMPFQALQRAFLPILATLALAASPSAAHAQWAYDDGGLKDLTTGLVWSESLGELTGSWWTWGGASDAAKAYSVNEYDANGNVIATFDDWRLPTRQELATAATTGTLQLLLPGSKNYYWEPAPGAVTFWTSERKGKDAYVVDVYYDSSGIITHLETRLMNPRLNATDAFMVRP
jgi:Protein of unknown function (DUF1566)